MLVVASLAMASLWSPACATPPSPASEESAAPSPSPSGTKPATPSTATPATATPAPLSAAEPHSAETAAEPRPTFRTATGTLAAYDRRERVLTIDSAAGSSRYLVAADARAWLGRRRLHVSDLASYVGAQVTLAFGEVDGVRTTHTVRLAEGERPGRAHEGGSR